MNDEDKTNPGHTPANDFDIAGSIIAKVVDDRLLEFLAQQKERDERIIEMLRKAIDAANENMAELKKVKETAESADRRSRANEADIQQIKRFLKLPE